MPSLQYICVAVIALQAAAAPTDPVFPHSAQTPLNPARKAKPLHGKFLHLTDFHPDRFYELYSSTTEASACHRGQGPAGLYGAETSECDSPIALVNATMTWIEQNLKDDIDFVLWTGDSARHDNDENIPRSPSQVRELNELMVGKMFEVFGKRNGDDRDEDPDNDFVVPVVPTFGNNDILPHNIMSKGPNTWTRAYTQIWRQFIPEEQRHQFEQGGWFYVEVIPHKLAVFSLNTLYFFDSNAAVDGCAAPKEPGYRHMEWLRIQLQFMRERGMKAILIGHVPPARNGAKRNWDETCWQKYALWLRQYRDVIVSSHFGHMNYDHFLLQDFRRLDSDTTDGRMGSYDVGSVEEADEEEGEVHELLSPDYFIGLRQAWSTLPKPPKGVDWPTSEAREIVHGQKKGGKEKRGKKRKQNDKQKKYLKKMGGPYAERYAASFVAASVVPNLYPTIRVFEYNVTGLDAHDRHSSQLASAPPVLILEGRDVDSEPLWSQLWTTISRGKVSEKPKKYRFTIPSPPSKSAPPGPAYSAQTLSLLKYTQYFANITHINNDFTPSADSTTDGGVGDGGVEAGKWKEGKHKGKKPHDRDRTPRPRRFKYEVHYDTQEDEVYRLRDLTMPSIVDLARRIGAFRAECGKAPEEEEEEEDGLSGEGEDIAEDVEEVDEEEVTVVNGKKHKQKKKHHRKHGKHDKRNEAWYTFVRRAFVETMDPAEMDEEFGH